MIGPRSSEEEFARRGEAIYEREIASRFRPDEEGKFVVIEIETGAYEADRDEIAASDHLLARHPDAQMWLQRGLALATRVASVSLTGRKRHIDHRGRSYIQWLHLR